MAMNILIGYGHFPGTTGIYIESALQRDHQVTYVGTPGETRPGFASNVDVAHFASASGLHPDLFIYVDSGNAAYLPRGLERLACPTVCYLIDAYPPITGLVNQFRLGLAPMFDYVFVAHRGCEPLYSGYREGLPVHWLPLACDPDTHADQHLERIHDVGFVGTVNANYPDRVRLLAALERRYKVSDYRRRYYMRDMARVYSQSRIVFNVTLKGLLNMRVFEVPPSGALLLTERSDHNGQSELLRDGEEFVTFSGEADLLQKVDYYLAHDDERERIARAGQSAVLSRHTYGHRVEHMLDVIRRDGARLIAPVRAWPRERLVRHHLRVRSMLRQVDGVMDEAGAPFTTRLYFAALAMLRRVKHRGG